MGGILNIVRMSVLPKLIYKYNSNTKSRGTFCRCEHTYSETYMELLSRKIGMSEMKSK